MPRKAEYKKWIWEYKKRRTTMRQHQLELTAKIKTWKRQIKRMEIAEAKVIALGNAIVIFTGMNIKNSGYTGKTYDRLRQAKSLFYKYGLENDISGKLLREYVGAERDSQPAEYRRNFTRLFETHPEYRELYNRFKIYIEEYLSTKTGE